MRRLVETELLDGLPALDPQAAGSRADLRRLNFIMGHAGILWRALGRHAAAKPILNRPLRVAELGAGDGSLALELARRWSAQGVVGELTLIDRQNLLPAATARAFGALHWSVRVVESDIFAWFEAATAPVDVMFANLFLHHFEADRLRTLLRLAATRTNLFVACEPRRAPLALTASRLLGLIGCNAVTRHDAVVSVRAGFAGDELARLWPATGDWTLSDRPVGLFSQCFVAQRHG